MIHPMLCYALLLILPAQCVIAVEPIRVLATGSASSVPYMAAIFKREPMTRAVVFPTLIPSGKIGLTTTVIRRFVRLYFPRRYEDLVAKYDIIVLRGIDSTFFTSMQFEWMRRSIDEEGMGGLQDRSVMSMHDAYSIPWSQSAASDAFPNDADAVVALDYHRNAPLKVILNEDPSLPEVFRAYKDVLCYHIGMWGNNLMIPREGSQIYTWAKTGKYPEVAFPEPGLFPHVLGWRYGEGYTWSLQDTTGRSFWDEEINPYGLDVYFSMMMYSSGRKLPTDVIMVHDLRRRFYEYSEMKGFILNLLEFVDKFGANTNTLEERVSEMDEKMLQSRDLYLDQEYLSSWTSLDDLIADISALSGTALKLKDKALFWIYVIEWLSISGTFLVASFAVWTLMIRRYLYRRVDSTRFRSTI